MPLLLRLHQTLPLRTNAALARFAATEMGQYAGSGIELRHVNFTAVPDDLSCQEEGMLAQVHALSLSPVKALLPDHVLVMWREILQLAARIGLEETRPP